MPISASFNQPFDLQVRFLRRKLDLPTEKWTDVQKAAHDRAFVVAGAMKADLVADLHAAVNRSAEDGLGIEAFRKDFAAIVARHGWTGWTGEGSAAGRAWRTRVIYQTNMATSYAAGRWAQVNDPDLAAFRPYIKYHHADGVMHPRPQHVSWNGLVLPRDHPFWKTHAPPNGWGCHCFVSAASQADYDKATTAGRAEPPGGWDAVSPKTGAPVGIDKGWDYAPGARADDSLRSFVQDRLIAYPPAIAQALTRDVTRWIDARTDVAEFAREALTERQLVKDLWLGFAANDKIEPLVGHPVRDYLLLLPADNVRHVTKSHEFDGGDQRPPRPEDYADAARWLADGEVTPGNTVDKKARIVARYRRGDEIIESVWEVRPGRRNRAVAFISMRVKVKR
jgi:hypothetical protein